MDSLLTFVNKPSTQEQKVFLSGMSTAKLVDSSVAVSSTARSPLIKRMHCTVQPQYTLGDGVPPKDDILYFISV